MTFFSIALYIKKKSQSAGSSERHKTFSKNINIDVHFCTYSGPHLSVLLRNMQIWAQESKDVGVIHENFVNDWSQRANHNCGNWKLSSVTCFALKYSCSRGPIHWSQMLRGETWERKHTFSIWKLIPLSLGCKLTNKLFRNMVSKERRKTMVGEWWWRRKQHPHGWVDVLLPRKTAIIYFDKKGKMAKKKTQKTEIKSEKTK